MMNDLEADTAEYILSKFGLLMVFWIENKYGLSVRGTYKAKTEEACWNKYRQVVIDSRIRLPGAFIGGLVNQTKDGYEIVVEIY